MKYYRSNYTGKIFTEKFAKFIDDVYGEGSFDYDVTVGNLVEIEPPSLLECVMHGNEALAIYRYREIYPGTSWEDGRRAVNIFKKDVLKEHKKSKKKSKKK